VNVARVQQKTPQVMTREVEAVQSTFEALQQAAALSDEQMCTLLHKHSVALEYGPERVIGTLQAVSTMFGMPDITQLQRGSLSCQQQAVPSESRHTASASDIFLPDVCHWDPCSQDSTHNGCVCDSGACDANQSSKASRADGLGQ